ncbi:MAG: hypothetical protein AAF745_15120 [Planctomycetota bacterium]
MYPNPPDHEHSTAQTSNEIQLAYRKSANAILSDVGTPTKTDPKAGVEKGIVICGGGPSYFVQAWVTIRTLRFLGCQLPVELWHLGESEMTPTMRSMVQSFDVCCRDAIALAATSGMQRLEGWAIKPFSILHSQFGQVLYLDSDCVPARDPSDLFDDPSFQRYGSLFWTDRYRGSGSPHPTVRSAAWPAMNVPFRDEAECESGQMLIDRERMRLELSLTLHFNQHAEYYYQFLYGDKDTFRLAWHRLGRHFNTVAYGPSSPVGFRVLYHFDPDGTLVFQHRARSKWSLENANAILPGFRHRDACETYLKELRLHWPSILDEFANATCPDRHQARQSILRQQTFRCWIGERKPISIRFERDGRIDADHPLIPSHWQIAEQPDGSFNLSLMGDRAAPLSLQWQSNRWVGRRMAGTRPPIELIPAASIDLAPLMDHSGGSFQAFESNAAYDDPTTQIAGFDPVVAYDSAPRLQTDDARIESPIAYFEMPLRADFQISPSPYLADPHVRQRVSVNVTAYDGPTLEPSAQNTLESIYEQAPTHLTNARVQDKKGQAEIKVHGLPRCCTNLITVLLRNQYHANVYSNQLGWKHGANLHSQGDRVNGRPLRFLVCVKHPYSWLSSFYRFDVRANGNPSSFREFVMGKCRTYAEQNPIERFNVLNRIWLAIGTSPAFLQVVWSEVLQSNQIGQLRVLESQFGLRRRTKHLRRETRRVGPDEQIRGRPFDASYYTNFEFMRHYDDELLSYVNQHLDRELIARLGYELFDCVAAFKNPTQDSIAETVSASIANGPF